MGLNWVLIAGGSGSLGGAIGQRISRDGTPTVSLDLVPPPSDCPSEHLQVDLSVAADTEAAIETLVRKKGAPATVIMAAGRYDRSTLLAYETSQVEGMFASNVLTVVNVLRFILPCMLARQKGQVVAITSQAGASGALDPIYASCKAAVTALIKSLAIEHSVNGIVFNVISCGPVDGTAMVASTTPERRQSYESAIPLGRLITVDEVVEVVRSIIEQRNPAMTGTTLDLDGGMLRR